MALHSVSGFVAEVLSDPTLTNEQKGLQLYEAINHLEEAMANLGFAPYDED